MNTRLQVEHPVTEEITGVDLVEWQLRVASGEPLPKRQDELSINGWAMEARLYAEDPAKGFLPSVGKLDWLTLHAGPGRVEIGVSQNDQVSSFYDPMIAKLVGQGDTRQIAIWELSSKLLSINVWPVRTNAGFLYRAVTHPEFGNANLDTGFIERHLNALLPPETPSEAALQDGMATLRWRDGAYEDEPWNGSLTGFRANRGPQETSLVCVDGRSISAPIGDFTSSWSRRDGPTELALVNENGQSYGISAWRVDGSAHGPASSGNILSPMPGRIIAVEVTQGQTVTKGQKLLTLEAMKMEHSLVAPFDGVVAELNAEVGAQVQVEALLVRVEAVGE
jgi:3-methylcrotonyl-CoA carboxylase alpha subunit